MLSKSEFGKIRHKLESYVKIRSISEPTEHLLEVFRSFGLGKMESIKMINQIFNIDISDAKNLVHCSPVWEDMYKVDQNLHNFIDDYIKSH